jgi:hypothetical protein
MENGVEISHLLTLEKEMNGWRPRNRKKVKLGG